MAESMDALLNADSKWKVFFSHACLKSFKKLSSEPVKKKSVINRVLRLSTGWRPSWKNVDLPCGNSSQVLKKYKVADLYLVCSREILKESLYTQVLYIWDVLPEEEIPKLVKRLEVIFGRYTEDYISRCSEKCTTDGGFEVPISWESSVEIIKFKNRDDIGNEAESIDSDQRISVEDSKVEESLLLMKFYSSPGVVSHLLSDREGDEVDLPFEVSDEQSDIILFPRSTFVLGRSGTGKTTVLTMKLFRKENEHRMAVEALCGHVESSPHKDRPVLRQLFVTLSPILCHAVKHHVVRLERSISGGNISTGSSSIEEDPVDVDTSIQFKNIPDSFINLPTNSYPLIITFQKFLMMLDGTLGNSFFERLSNQSSHSLNPSAVASETFIRKKEVTYDRFDSSYWHHFNSHHIKTLDSSRVFTEIISHIKGGIRAVESGDGKLSRKDYLSLITNRDSSLSEQERGIIYDIYQSYEKLKMDKGDFDLADIVIDIHDRLKIKRYEGDEMHFVYIDEVQDLTMSQIALFKHVCQNVEGGFVFCGDTAQTIARGIDFKFQDIRSLFYRKFVLESDTQGKDKGKISDILLLNQNFRTHAGVVKLSQSIIELLSRFFPCSIDVLKPETSVIYGEGPVVLQRGNGKNAIATIFGSSGGHVGGKIVGFGAEQVILVRDDSARKEIVDCIGKQALVLTVLECKGLEFQDVLLYNFFGSSPLKKLWRVIYEYMKEQDMLEPTELKSYPIFNHSKHYILCSELKQLYVAITRARQRLWICEDKEEFSIPVFDYWKKKGLVQFKELNDSLAQAMKVASSAEEWRSSGKKLFYQKNYEMATVCFEKAGDSYWERKSKAAGLRAGANRLHDLNPEGANAMLREAAEIFEGIEMADSAAQCFSDLGDYERAAQVYAGGSFFSDCLTVCAKGGLLEIGLSYIEQWKQNESARSDELDTAEQNFLASCARNYFDGKDTSSMMKCVRAFHSMDLKSEFLRQLSLHDELLVLEEESGNFMEAANIAKMMGDIPREADLLGKAGKFVEAYELVLSFVLAHSLWPEGSKGWPLKQFEGKDEHLGRALSFAKEESHNLYELASKEVEILSNEHSNISRILILLKSSRTYGSVRGEILCLWKLLDAHLQLKWSKYFWQDNMLNDSDSVEEIILKNQLSVETLFYCWTCWKDSMVRILEYLPNLKSHDIHQHSSYGKFALNILGVQKQISNQDDKYLLLIPDANWVLKLGERSLQKDGRLVFVDVQSLISAAENYWLSELVSVGMDVLRNLDALYKLSVTTELSEFCQFRSLMLIYEVSKFLLESKCSSHRFRIIQKLDNYHRHPIDNFFRYVVPLDWKKSVSKDMVSLRLTKACEDLGKEVIHENIKPKGRLTYGQIGRVVVMILGTANPKNELCVEIMKRFEANRPWKEFIQSLQWNSATEISQGNETIYKFYKALEYTYDENVSKTREVDYISPSCFMYLIERLLLFTSFRKGFIYATKSSFVEWLISLPNLSLLAEVHPDRILIHELIAFVIDEFLDNPDLYNNWIKKSNLNVKYDLPLFVVRLVVLLCLLHLSSGKFLGVLDGLLRNSQITTQLPLGFYNVLWEGRERLGLKVFAEAFKMIDNPLVVVRLGNNSSEILCPDAVFVDFKICHQREHILQVLFPNSVDNVGGETSAVTVEASGSTSDRGMKYEINKSTNADYFWDMLGNMQLAVDESCLNVGLHNSTIIKEFLDPCIELLNSSISGSLSENPVNLESKTELEEVVSLLDEMKQLSSALSVNDSLIENRNTVIGELAKKILSRRPKVAHVLNQLVLINKKNTNVEYETSQASMEAGNDDQGQNDLEESEDNKNSQGAINSGSGSTRENIKGKKNKSKKSKGGKKGRK